MISSLPINKSYYANNWKKLAIWGFALCILGLIAISATLYTTLFTIVALGIIITAAGIILLIDSFSFWKINKKALMLHLIMGILYIAAGAMLVKDPLAGSISLTLLLGILYLVLGAFRIIYAITHRTLRWSLNLLNGLLSVVIGILILSSWPFSGLYIIGLFVGIDLVVCGWVYLMTAFAARSLANR